MKQKTVSTQLINDTRSIIESARQTAYKLADLTLVRRNWLLGKRIAQEELDGADRADYGTQVIKGLSKVLTDEYGKGFDRANLYHFLNFYKAFPIKDSTGQIVYTPCGQSGTSATEQKIDTLCRQSGLDILDAPCPAFNPHLSWSHYRIILQVNDSEARQWYAAEAARENWSVRTLQRKKRCVSI